MIFTPLVSCTPSIFGPKSVLLVRVTVAAFFVASEVLSTLPSPISVLSSVTSPVSPLTEVTDPPDPPVAASISVIVLAVTVLATWYPIDMDLAVVPSCSLVTVKTSPLTAVTRMISAFESRGITLAGHTVILNGGVENSDPSPPATVKLVPLSFGSGAIRIVEYAKLACASKLMCQHP